MAKGKTKKKNTPEEIKQDEVVNTEPTPDSTTDEPAVSEDTPESDVDDAGNSSDKNNLESIIIEKYYSGDKVLANKRFSAIKKIAENNGTLYENELLARYNL